MEKIKIIKKILRRHNGAKTKKAKTILRKKNTAVGNTFCDFKYYYRTTANKIIWYWHKTDT